MDSLKSTTEINEETNKNKQYITESKQKEYNLKIGSLEWYNKIYEGRASLNDFDNIFFY